MMFSAKMAALISLATSASMSPTPRLSEGVPSPERKEGPVFYHTHGSMLGKRPALPFGNCYPAPRGNRRTGNGPPPAVDRVSTCVEEARAKLRRTLRRMIARQNESRRLEGIEMAAHLIKLNCLSSKLPSIRSTWRDRAKTPNFGTL